MKKFLLTSILLLGLPILLLAQEEEIPQDTIPTPSDTIKKTFQFLDGAPVTIDLQTEEEEEDDEDDKKKEKRKVYKSMRLKKATAC